MAPDLVASTRTERSARPGRRRAFERVMDLFAARLWQLPRRAHLPLRAVRAHRPEAAHGPPRDARGCRRPPAPRQGAWSTSTASPARRSLPRSRATASRSSSRSTGSSRDVALRDATSSIVVFEEWLELSEGERPGADHLERIERLQPRRRGRAPAGCGTGSKRFATSSRARTGQWSRARPMAIRRRAPS